MKDFIYAALPWIIMGLTIAVLAVKFSKINSKKIMKLWINQYG